MTIAGLSHSGARRWMAEGRPMAVATLVATDGSSPFEPGAMMLVDADGNIEGSVTGGCVEGAVAEEALEAIADGESHGGLGVTELLDRTVEREMRGMLEQVQNARSADRLRDAERPIHSERELLHLTA